MYWPFYDSGFTITGVDKVNYQAGSNITFNCTYLSAISSVYKSATWNFYRSEDYSLIKSTGGLSSTTTFTLAEGKDGIDVELILDFGLHRTKFRKRRRVVIIPDKTTATRTLDISTIPMISGAGVAFTNSTTASVTAGSTTVNTSANHGVSVGDIVVLTQTVSRTYQAQSGTTGTTLILDRGWEGTTATLTNANTRKGLDIQHRFDASSWSPGDIVHLTGKLYTARCRWINLNGTSENEIWLTVSNGSDTAEFIRVGTAQDDAFQLNDLCSNLRIVGDKDGSGNYRLKFTNGGFSAQHFSIGNTHDHDNIRLATIRVHNADSTGIKPKLDSVNRTVGAWDDCWVYDNYITDSTNEGIYIGYFNYTYDSGFLGGDYHHAMKRAKCWANYVEGCGWDAIQMSSCDEEAECSYNFMKNNATSNESPQNFGAVLNGGWNGHFYNNIIIGNTMQCIPAYTTYLYNNVIYSTFAYTPSANGLYVRRGDNPSLGSPIYNPYDVNAILYCWNNIISSVNDSIYILDNNDQGGVLAPLVEINIFNNFLGYTGSAVEGFIRYNEPASGQVRTTTPNITTSGASAVPTAVAFYDYSNDDTRLLNTSSVFSSSNGTDMSTVLDATDLPIQMFTDISDQIIPERGYWKQSPHHEYVGHETELADYMGRTQIQYYQTSQTSTFSDKEKIPRFYGGTVNKCNVVGGSSKPRYLSAVKAYPNSGTPSSETFDGTSYT
jgi:hypothetical protein